MSNRLKWIGDLSLTRRTSPRNGYDPNKWGLHVWTMIHLAALAYPNKPSQEEKLAMYQFFQSLQYVLPCPICADNFREKLQETNFGNRELDNREALFNWTVLIHSMVNEKKHKPALNNPQYWKSFYESKFE